MPEKEDVSGFWLTDDQTRKLFPGKYQLLYLHCVSFTGSVVPTSFHCCIPCTTLSASRWRDCSVTNDVAPEHLCWLQVALSIRRRKRGLAEGLWYLKAWLKHRPASCSASGLPHSILQVGGSHCVPSQGACSRVMEPLWMPTKYSPKPSVKVSVWMSLHIFTDFMVFAEPWLMVSES